MMRLTIGRMASLACLLEVTAPKPGNVHRGADFEDVTFLDFIASAEAIGNVIDQMTDATVGELILASTRQTQAMVGTNTNLGIILLFAPLVCAARAGTSEREQLDQIAVQNVLVHLSGQDGADVFQAIQLAKPGGLGDAEEMDVQTTKGPVDLMAAMKQSSGRDAIARQYVNSFDDVFGIGQKKLSEGMYRFQSIEQAIIYTHVAWMADEADSLIQRKCGEEAASHSQFLAKKAMDQIANPDSFWQRVAELDFWLRSDGHRRNPGTTADLVAASLLVAIYNQTVKPPFK